MVLIPRVPMIRHARWLAACLLVGCASTAVPAHHELAPDALASRPADARPSDATAEPVWSSSISLATSESISIPASEPIALEPQQQPPPGAYPPPPPPPPPRGRLTIKGGYYGADEDELDDGWIGAVSWMQFVAPVFSTEFEIGYLDVEGKEGGVDTELWALPIMFNGRFGFPVGRFELYGGAGFGTIYYDGEADGALIDVSADGWLGAGDVFAGAALNLRNAMTVGIEWKHYFTESSSDLDTGLDADAVMLTLGFNR